MKRYRVFVGLGSNVGERERHLRAAATELKSVRDTHTVWYSSVYETDPYGNREQPKFLNVVGELETALSPPELLQECQGIEKRLGRILREHWGPREIDIDLLIYDGLVFQDETVQVPHPDLEGRRFVLVPLREIAPDLVHPISGMTVEEMAASCPDRGRVVKTSFTINP
jgi:2-amino-4-hydroxy-6-hydroxymethyldihydropteridine diphosphokinase